MNNIKTSVVAVNVLAHIFIVTFLLSALGISAETMPDSTSTQTSYVKDDAFYTQYPFIRVVDTPEEAQSLKLSDEEFFDNAGKVVFKVNTYDVYTNDSLLHLLKNEIIPRINKDSLELRRLIVRGAASPEGPVPNNRMLGRKRVGALTSFLRDCLTVPVDDESFSSEAVTEDYNMLLLMMERAGDPDYETVRSLCERHLPRYEYTLMKNKLKKLQDGQLWGRLLKTYFPELRATRVVMVFERNKKPLEQHVAEDAVVDVQPAVEPSAPTDTMPLPQEPIDIRRRELLSVKTNLLFYGVYMPGGYDRWCPIPNVAVEYYPLSGHFTFGGSFDCPWWIDYDNHKFFEVRNYQLETRYYLKPSKPLGPPGSYRAPAFSGLYLQGYVNAGLFEIGFNRDKGWKGEGYGAGVGAGYVMPITRNGHWRLEFALQVGWFTCKYDPFQYENLINLDYHDDLYYYRWTGKASDFKRRQYRYNWIGPTRVGVTLSYDLLYRRQQKKGASFKPFEPRERRIAK